MKNNAKNFPLVNVSNLEPGKSYTLLPANSKSLLDTVTFVSCNGNKLYYRLNYHNALHSVKLTDHEVANGLRVHESAPPILDNEYLIVFGYMWIFRGFTSYEDAQDYLDANKAMIERITGDHTRQTYDTCIHDSEAFQRSAVKHFERVALKMARFEPVWINKTDSLDDYI